MGALVHQHKIIRGLLDAYTLTGNTKAREVVVKMADWAHNALTTGDKNHPSYPGPITRDNLNLMWDTYIAGELGGANEVFAGDPRADRRPEAPARRPSSSTTASRCSGPRSRTATSSR